MVLNFAKARKKSKLNMIASETLQRIKGPRPLKQPHERREGFGNLGSGRTLAGTPSELGLKHIQSRFSAKIVVYGKKCCLNLFRAINIIP